MSPKTVTHDDLVRVRNEIERAEDQKRHDLRDSMQKAINMADDAKDLSKDAISSVNSMDKRMENMERNIKAIGDSMDKRFDRMEVIFQRHAEQEEEDKKELYKRLEDDKIKADEKFATKKEHEANVSRIGDIEKTYVSALKWLLGALGVTVLTLAGLIWNNLHKFLG